MKKSTLGKLMRAIEIFGSLELLAAAVDEAMGAKVAHQVGKLNTLHKDFKDAGEEHVITTRHES